MKNFIKSLAGAFMALPIALFAQTYTAQSGVSFAVSVPATATYVSGPVRLPNFSGLGTLTITETGITGSPSGCTVKLSYQSNVATTATSAVATVSFTPATGVQTFTISPSVVSGDQYVATYACSSTYPTAGTLSASFSPVAASSTDPCLTAPKSSVAISQATAGTVQLVALSAGKTVYVCGVNDGSAGTTPSIELEYGTGSACGTGTTALTGAVPFTSGSVIHLDIGGGTLTQSAAGNALCALTVGNGHYGVLTYVQQ